MHENRDVAATFLLWVSLRAVFHRGYVLTSGLYFVVEAQLSASRLVLLGTAISLTLVLTTIPTGVLADTLGRRRSLVIGHVFLATGMVMTGVVTGFPLLVVTQVLWGAGWAFLTGADVAWITDELAQPQRIATLLAAAARFESFGGAVGMIVFGLLGSFISLSTAIVASGIGMALLGLFVAARFREQHERPPREHSVRPSLSIFRRATRVVRHDHEILLVCVATLLLNAASKVAWLFPKQLVHLGFPPDPVLWYTAIGICAQVLGFVMLSLVQARINGIGVARRMYATACIVGMLGLLVLAQAPSALIGGAGVILVSGIAFPVTRTVSVIWVNRRTGSPVRATVHSWLDLAESSGEICGGVALALIAGAAGVLITLLTSAALLAFTATLVALSRTDRATPDSE